MSNKNTRARFSIKENFTYRLLDAQGNAKKLFKTNALGEAILKTARKFYVNPTIVEMDEDGKILGNKAKNNIFAKVAVYGLRIPFLTGRYVESLQISNLVTNAGKAGVASRINGAGSEAAFTAIAIGIGTTAAAAGDTALESEITTNGGGRGAATASRTTTDVSNDTATLVKTFSFTGSFAVTEAGSLNNTTSGGVLLNRQVFTAVNVVSGDSLQVTINIDVD
jgi:hypothetical protein